MITIKQILQRLKENHGIEMGYYLFWDYVSKKGLLPHPARSHKPGQRGKLAEYPEHIIDSIVKIDRLKREGFSLSQIADIQRQDSQKRVDRLVVEYSKHLSGMSGSGRTFTFFPVTESDRIFFNFLMAEIILSSRWDTNEEARQKVGDAFKQYLQNKLAHQSDIYFQTKNFLSDSAHDEVASVFDDRAEVLNALIRLL